MSVTVEILDSFLARCQALVDEYHRLHYPNIGVPRLTYTAGQRFIRVVAVTVGNHGVEISRSAWCFIDVNTGDVLKPDGWKRPAKHARGNLFDAHQGMLLIGPYGPAYLK